MTVALPVWSAHTAAFAHGASLRAEKLADKLPAVLHHAHSVISQAGIGTPDLDLPGQPMMIQGSGHRCPDGRRKVELSNSTPEMSRLDIDDMF